MRFLPRKLREPGVLPPPQQSDYEQSTWIPRPGDAAPQARAGMRQTVVRQLARTGLINVASNARARWQALSRSGTSLPEPDYQRVVVRDLLRDANPK